MIHWQSLFEKGDPPGSKIIKDRGKKHLSAALLTCVGFGKRGESGWAAASMWVSLEGWQNSAWELYVYLKAKERDKHSWIPKQHVHQAGLKQLLQIILL